MVEFGGLFISRYICALQCVDHHCPHEGGSPQVAQKVKESVAKLVITDEDGKKRVMNRLHLRGLVVAAFVLVPGTAAAHAYIHVPPARNIDEPNLTTRGGIKTGPCGTPRTNKPPTQYAVGAQVQVMFRETVAHTGCYQVHFSPAGDANWVKLGQMDDPGGVTGNVGGVAGMNALNVTLPAGVSAMNGTLRVTQIMSGVTCTANANQDPGANTYFSCSDIRVGDFADAGPTTMPPPAVDAGPGDPGSSSGGPNTEPTPGNGNGSSSGNGNEGTTPGSRRLGSGNSNDDGGCSSVGSTNSDIGIGAGLAALVGLLAVVRRRRK
jgi:uncharacterized protein (TIGR03382 family)